MILIRTLTILLLTVSCVACADTDFSGDAVQQPSSGTEDLREDEPENREKRRKKKARDKDDKDPNEDGKDFGDPSEEEGGDLTTDSDAADDGSIDADVDDAGGELFQGEDGLGFEMEEEPENPEIDVGLSQNLLLDGHLKFCLNFRTGVLSVTNLYTKFFHAQGTFVVRKKPGGRDVYPIAGEGSQTIRDWVPHCGANPNRPTVTPVDSKDHNPPVVSVGVAGDLACLEVDDAEGGRSGAVRVPDFDFGLEPCP